MESRSKEEFVINLTDEYVIKSSSRSGFTLQYTSSKVKKVRSPKTGGTVDSRETATAYYGTLHQALKGFVKHYYERSNSLDEVVARVEEAMAVINTAIEAMNSVDKTLVEKYKVVNVSSN